jgi:RsiW-degrading membrane proteinase PrsW (M82 family)
MHIGALILATIIPLFVLYAIYALDFYEMGTFRSVIICFVWGGIAFVLARFINRGVYFTHLISYPDITRYFAPVVEEILKAIILVYLVRRLDFTYFVDGAIYGFAVGIGFAIFENYEYILTTPGPGLGIAIARVLSVNLIHASATALVGVTLGLARFKHTSGRLVLLLFGLAAAILLHGIFNNIVTRDIPGPILIYAAILGLSAVGFIVFLILRGLGEQRSWIEEKLGPADRVTTGEARIVYRLEDVRKLLEPARRMFGEEKSNQIEQFLIIQARLGILRKTLDKLPDEKMRQEVEQQITDLRVEMDQARRAVGSYAMLYVRNIFPEETSPLWSLLESRIQDRIQAKSTTAGDNLFTSLEQRLTQRSVEQDDA